MKLNHILEGIEVLSVVGNKDVEVLNVGSTIQERLKKVLYLFV